MNGSSSQVMYHEWVLGPGGNLQKARAETESSILAEWRHAMGDNCQGREGDWVLGKTKLEGCLKRRLSQSSEEFRKWNGPLNGGEECGSLSCHPEKGGQFWGRVIISNNSKGLSPALIYITCLSQKWSPIPLMNDPLTICLHEVHMWSKVYHT